MNFSRQTAGNVAMIFAILLVPLITAVGIAIDFNRRSAVQTRLQEAADAAALAGLRYVILHGETGAADAARNMFDANAGAALAMLEDLDIDLQPSSGEYQVTVSANVDPLFMQIAGVPNMGVNIASVAAGGAAPVEIAFGLDVTGSLVWSGVYQDLIDETADLVDRFEAAAYNGNFYLSIIPFAGAVNVGDSRTSWLTGYNASNFSPGAWDGCVFARQSGDLDISDAPPADGLWEPFLWRRDYSSAQGYNDWSGEPASSYRNMRKAAEFGTGVSTLGPNVGCSQPLHSLDNNYANLRAFVNSIDEFASNGGTNLAQGFVWAWRTISPNWRGEWGGPTPSSMPSDSARKIVIFLSDGQAGWSTETLGDYHVFGYGEPDYPVVEAENLTNATRLSKRFEDACDEAKADGVEVITILFANSNGQAREALRKCASSNANFFEAEDRDALSEAYDQIAQLATALRIVR